MTRERIRATQARQPPKPARLLRGTVAAVSPLTVTLAGGGTVAGIAVPGAVYAVGDTVQVLWQEPGVGPVYPLALATSLGAFSYAGTGTDWDTAAGGTRGSSVTRSGATGTLHVQMKVGATVPTAGGTLLTIAASPAGFRPALTATGFLSLFNGAWSGSSAVVDIAPNGVVSLNVSSTTIAANAGLFGSVSYPLV